MLSRLWLNALPDSGSSLIHKQTTCTFYFGALAKSSSTTAARPTRMLTRFSPAASLTLPSSQKHSNAYHTHSHLYYKMIRTAGATCGSAHLAEKCFPRSALTGTLLLQGVLSQPACGVAKWSVNSCLLFSSSRSVGSKVKRGNRSITKAIVGDKKSSAVETIKTSKIKHQQFKDNLKAKIKLSPDSDFVDMGETTKSMNGRSSKCAIEVATASDEQQSSRSGRSKSNKGEKAKKNELKIEESNEKYSQVSLMEVTVCDKLQAKSSSREKVDKCDQPQKRKSKTSRTYKKASAKQSQVAAGDSNVEVTVCDKPQAKSSPLSKVDKGNQPKKNNLTIQKIGRKDSARQLQVADTNSSKKHTVCDKLEAKSSPRSKADKGDQPNKKNLEIQKTDYKASTDQSQVATRDSSRRVTVSDKLQTKSTLMSKTDKGDQSKKNNLKTQKTSAKQSQIASKGISKRENIEVSENVGKTSAIYKNTSGPKLHEADKESLTNTKCSSHNGMEVTRKQKKITPSHVKGKVVVVVESETKAKTINKYLGDKFVVLASYGHVRDLARRAGSVRPNEGFSMIWEVPSTAWIHIKRIEGAVIGARSLLLASDPDREGESIAWHVMEMLKQQGSLNKNIIVQRVVFHEITQAAILKAIESPRDISLNLVNACHARRALDYLIGFSISPLLWRKLPGCKSAGRVQSAALSLICDREKEIEKFVPEEYWSIEAKACGNQLPLSGRDCAVLAKVTQVDGKKLSINSQVEAKKVVEKILQSKFIVVDLKRSVRKRNPPLPYITSSLQRDASNKLNFSALYTMKLAQQLYEGVKLSDNEVSGLITYMRTDGLRISEEAVESIRLLVTQCYGEAYATKGVRIFQKKVKNAQEAHEAIRPTDIRRRPSMLANILEKDLLKLYTLIWCQTVASQMTEAKIDQISASFGNEGESVILRSSGSEISFPGYLTLFQEYKGLIAKGEEIQQMEEDDKFDIQQKEADGNFSFISELKKGDPIYMNEVQSLQHFTEPQPRYSEGSLITKLEELGIGRPSTYAPIIKTLQDRKYITCKNRRIHPEFRGRMVSAFLSHYFPEIINYGFTASMESQLDDIATGSSEWKNVLSEFWESFHPVCERVSKVGNDEVGNMLEETFQDYLFGALPEEDRICPVCKKGKLMLKVSRYGAGYFLGCNAYPKCSYIARTLFSEEDKENTREESPHPVETKLLGTDPDSNQQVFLKVGPYGYYIQLGEDLKGWKPKRMGVSQIKDVTTMKLEEALELLRYPVLLGKHPQDKKPVQLVRMKYGFAVRYRHLIASVPEDVDPHSVTLEMAIDYMKGKDTRKLGRPGHKKKIKGTED